MEQQTNLSKIEETVLSILKKADIELDTELSVRAKAEARLGFDLSSIEHKNIVRRVVETFLLSTTEEEEKESGHLETEWGVKEKKNKEVEFEAKDGQFICKLSERKGVSVHGAKGNSLVSIRDYFPEHGKLVHSYRGISLSSEQWSAFKKSIPDIEAAITKMESHIRSEDASKHSRANMTNSKIPVAQGPLAESTHFQADISNTYVPYSSPRELVPVQTPRLDGKNYHCWVHLMELFLKQMNIAYVLTEPCPISPLRPEACSEEILHAKTTAPKWINDDYICRHSILNSLCDHLFERYSKICNSAKELWKELKLAYDDDVKTTRSQVNKYIHFQMVDGISVLEQVQELHKIADCITASGVGIDENFHVSAIVSKLPLSWKNYRSELMQEDFLPLNMLMHRIRLEEEARNHAKGEEFFMKARDRAKGEEFSMKARDSAKGEDFQMKTRDSAKEEDFQMKTRDYTKEEQLLMKARRGEPRKDRFRPKNRVWKRP